MAAIGNRRMTLGQLYVGLTLYGVSMALMIESTLGLAPWGGGGAGGRAG